MNNEIDITKINFTFYPLKECYSCVKITLQTFKTTFITCTRRKIMAFHIS